MEIKHYHYPMSDKFLIQKERPTKMNAGQKANLELLMQSHILLSIHIP